MRRTGSYMVMWILDSGLTSNAKPEHLEDAISRLRALLCLPSLPPSSRADITKSLDRFVQRRSLYFGATGNSAETPLNDSGVVPSSSLSPMLTSNQSTAELANDVMAQSNEDKRLEELLIAIRNNENTDVEEIVKLGRTFIRKNLIWELDRNCQKLSEMTNSSLILQRFYSLLTYLIR